jgi:dimethylamine/trimethylamine dehydrogenase
MKRLRSSGVEIITQRLVRAYEGGAVICEDAWTSATSALEADALVAVTTRAPNDSLYQDLLPRSGAFTTLKVIGDAEAPGLIAHAIYAGHRAARELGETPREVPFRRHLPRFVT